MSFDEISVPTQDTIKYVKLTTLLLKCNYHTLKFGNTGTAKSLNCNILLKSLTEFLNTTLTLSARTEAEAIRDTLDMKFKRRKFGV